MTDALLGLRLYHWAPAALFVTGAWAHLLHVAKKHSWNLEQDIEVERYRDEARTTAADKVREAQAAWVPNLEPFDWQRDKSSYFDNKMFDYIWPWLQEKGVRLTRIHAMHWSEATEESMRL
eukprot:6406467-Pyramimonas_sp.AAC.1